MSQPDDSMARIEALIREGNQRVAGEILALRTRVLEITDAVNELRERAGLPPAQPRSRRTSNDEPLRAPLIDLTERLEKVTESVRDLETVRTELGKAGEVIGERVGAKAERSFRRLEDSFAAMRMQIDTLAQQVRARPESDVTPAIRAGVKTLGDELRAEFARLADGLRNEISIEIIKELESLREPVQMIREHAVALRGVSGITELAAEVSAVATQLQKLDARLHTASNGRSSEIFSEAISPQFPAPITDALPTEEIVGLHPGAGRTDGASGALADDPSLISANDHDATATRI